MTSTSYSYRSRNSESSAPPISRLSKVVQLIDSGTSNDLSSLFQPFLPGRSPESNLSEGQISKTAGRLKLHIEHESPEFWEQTNETAGSQVEQLIKHVRTRKRELDQREADLQANVYRWEQETMKVKAELNRRTAEVEQLRSQLNWQRVQLIKLQQNLVTTQTNLRAVVEKIVDQCEPEELKLELGKLRFELNESMDVILRRWETLQKGLELR